ncbi:MAG TPA: type II toxin-antitoxin system VapC family toxin [Blastocatellia bacterium]
MSGIVADTHAIVWYFVEPVRLSANARALIEQTALAGEAIYVSAISIIEICYLVDKGRLSAMVLQRVVNALRDANAAVEIIPVDLDVALALPRIARADVPDMPDRIIAATALHLNVPLISRDRQIRATGIHTIW